MDEREEIGENPIITIETNKPYTLKVGSFEGPLDLLLQLIESRKLFINEISLAEVTNDYIEFIKKMPSYNLLDTTYFVIIASTLLFIKSRSLIPNIDLTANEEENIYNLENRLKLYQTLKQISDQLSVFSKKHTLFERQNKEKEIPIFVPDYKITIQSIRENISNVFKIKEDEDKKEKLHQIEITRVMSIDEMMNDLEERITRNFSFKWTDIKIKYPNATEKEVKVHTIVTFLALLEMVRNGIIDVLQNNEFEDMMISGQDQLINQQSI